MLDKGLLKQAGLSEAAARREAERTALREARLAEALRQNLKRRKEQARGRVTSPEQADAADERTAEDASEHRDASLVGLAPAPKAPGSDLAE